MNNFILVMTLLAKAIGGAAAPVNPVQEAPLPYPEPADFWETDVDPFAAEPDDSTLLGCPGSRRCDDGTVRELEYMDPSCHYGCPEEDR
jgi:hypothetical protein